MARKRVSSNDIQTNAFNNVRSDFQEAAKKGSQALAEYLAERDIICNTTCSYNGRLHDLQFLLKGAKGEYCSREEYSRLSSSIWKDYLQDAGKLSHGWGSALVNEETIEKLIKQNGPKKMEQRLSAFLKRRINKAVKSCGHKRGF